LRSLARDKRARDGEKWDLSVGMLRKNWGDSEAHGGRGIFKGIRVSPGLLKRG